MWTNSCPENSFSSSSSIDHYFLSECSYKCSSISSSGRQIQWSTLVKFASNLTKQQNIFHKYSLSRVFSTVLFIICIIPCNLIGIFFLWSFSFDRQTNMLQINPITVCTLFFHSYSRLFCLSLSLTHTFFIHIFDGFILSVLREWMMMYCWWRKKNTHSLFFYASENKINSFSYALDMFNKQHF